MVKIINIYTKFEKKQAIIKPKTVMYSDIVATAVGRMIVDFIQVDDIISSSDSQGNTIQLERGKRIDNDLFQCILLEKVPEAQSYSILGEPVITIGSLPIHHIVLNNVDEQTFFVLEQIGKSVVLYPSPKMPIYVNNISQSKRVVVSKGDVLDIYGMLIIIGENRLEIRDAVTAFVKTSLIPVETTCGLSQLSSQYKRSPRLIYSEPHGHLRILAPPKEPIQSTESLLKNIVLPLSMTVVTILTGIFMNHGFYVYMMVFTTVVTLIMSIINFCKQRKEHKKKMENRIEVYDYYLKRKLSEVSEYVSKQAKACYYHNPENDVILKMIETGSSRMWEKSVHHHDFLHIRIGRAKIPLSFEVELNEEDFSEKEDQLFEDAKAIYNHFKSANHLPRTVCLMRKSVGLIGSPYIMREQIAMIINQIGFFHSYRDVELIHLYDAADHWYWSKFDFMPHMNSKMLHTRTNIFLECAKDQLLGSFFQLLKARQNIFDENKGGGNTLNFSPHFVLIINDMKQVIEHSIMEYLSKDVSHLEVSVIYVDQTLKNLPEHVTTVVEYQNEKEGQVVIEAGVFKQERIECDHLSDGFQLATIPRILAGYTHVQALKSSIPSKIGYLEMFGVERVEELNIHERWISGDPRKTLAVPLGCRKLGDIVMLNLHEKAHGPHGLVAGTTGSGKSELIQTYILSLATNFHPYDVSFLLIDYKGGGMSNHFKNLPHLLGTITNLDGTQLRRALAAIKTELFHRQKLFSENNVNHIDGYQRLFRERKVTEPMPHLFVMSDEFAELKSEQPECMKELISTARLGRSLGIHLILATQKPSGVVDDQIWSNSKFRLCLKVQNINDSNEVLKTPDAATIIRPGRAYLQVGNNEVYELFQSAYSGFPYVANIERNVVQDNRIYEINELGQYELKTKDLSKGKSEKSTRSELDVVVAEVKRIFDETGLTPVPSPWLEPLGEFISQDQFEMLNVKQEWEKIGQNGIVEQLDMVVGVTDELQNRAQNVLKMNLSKGHIGIFGAAGFGKTVMIQSMIMSLVRKNSPSVIHFYLLDFGQALLPLQPLPHVADLITIDEEEKIRKWICLMVKLIKTRKRLFKKNGVSDIETYHELTGEKIKRVIVVLDNYDGTKDVEFGDDLDKTLVMLTREGLSLGIHVIISAMRDLRYQLMANMKEKITYFQIEISDVLGIMGRTQMRVPEIPGRGLVKLDDIYEFQTLLPNDKETQGERITALRAEAFRMREMWKGEVPKKIPIVPEVLTAKTFLNYSTVQAVVLQPHMASIGVDFESVRSVTLDLSQDPIILVIGTRQRMKSVVETILLTVFQKMTVLIVGTDDRYYRSFEKYGIITEKKVSWINTLKPSISGVIKRKEAYDQLINEGKSSEAEALRQTWDDKLFVIMDARTFALEMSSSVHKQFQILMEKGQIYRVYFIYGMAHEAYNRIDGDIGQWLKTVDQLIVLSKISDVSRINVSKSTFREPEITSGTANYVKNGDFMKFKLVDEIDITE